MPTRPPSVHSTASSTDSEDCDENYVAMVSNMSADEPVCNTTLPHCQYTSLQSPIMQCCKIVQLKVWFSFSFFFLLFVFFNGSISLSAIEIKEVKYHELKLFTTHQTANAFGCSWCSSRPRRPRSPSAAQPASEKPSGQQGAPARTSYRTAPEPIWVNADL